MTAAELHRLSRDDDPSYYAGGLDLRGGATRACDSVGLVSQRGDIHMTVTVNSGPGYAQTVLSLDLDEAYELSMALHKAAEAAERNKA